MPSGSRTRPRPSRRSPSSRSCAAASASAGKNRIGASAGAQRLAHALPGAQASTPLRYHRAPHATPFSRPVTARPWLRTPLEELRYIALGFAVLVAIALPIFPRLGIVGLTLLLPLITRLIPRAGPGINS